MYIEVVVAAVVIYSSGTYSSTVCSSSSMKWLRLVVSIKIKVSFAKEPYKRDLYSAQETYFLQDLLFVAISKEPTNHREV